jgi:glycosyltransferase involved in cell wall biosynthesis
MISVIVPVRNGMPWLDEQLRALAGQRCDEPWEIVVVDNGSTDASAALIEEWAERSDLIRLVNAPAVKGPGAARNAGARAAKGDLLAFCDADDVVQPGWLASHVTALAEAEVVGGVFDVWSLNGLATPSPATPSLPSAMSQFGFLPAVMSGNLAVRRPVFEEVGGFAEDLRTGEDIDLSWRLQLKGHACEVNRDAVVARRDQRGFWRVFRRHATYGACGPILYQRFRSDGLRPDLMLAVKTWGWLAVTAPKLRRADFRSQWAATAGWRTGRLIESLRRRVFFP